MLDIIKSMYNAVNSKVKSNNNVESLRNFTFSCKIGVRQGEFLSPFLFAMYVNDLGQELENNGVKTKKIYVCFRLPDLP